MISKLLAKHCKACEGGVTPLTREEASALLTELAGWILNPEGTAIQCTYAFKNYYHTIAFVNALAYLSHHENHHPDLEVSYNRCVVRYTTHAIKGLSENDFICATKAHNLMSF